MLVARIALVTSSISASPLVMGGVIVGITLVDSTVPAISAPSMVLPHPAGSAGTLAAVIALVSADPAMVTPAGIAPEVSLLAASVAVVMALVSTAPSIVLPHDEVRAGIWDWFNTPVMMAALIVPAIREPSIVLPQPAGSAGTFAAVIALVSADPAIVTPAPIAPDVSAVAANVADVSAPDTIPAATVPTNREPSIVFPQPAGSAGMLVGLISSVDGFIGASRLCGATMAVMKLPTAVAALNAPPVSAGLSNIANRSVKYWLTSVTVPDPAAKPTVSKMASITPWALPIMLPMAVVSMWAVGTNPVSPAMVSEALGNSGAIRLVGMATVCKKVLAASATLNVGDSGSSSPKNFRMLAKNSSMSARVANGRLPNNPSRSCRNASPIPKI